MHLTSPNTNKKAPHLTQQAIPTLLPELAPYHRRQQEPTSLDVRAEIKKMKFHVVVMYARATRAHIFGRACQSAEIKK